MRFGGAMISLILPKLTRSVARDGIGTFGQSPAPGRHWLFLQTTQKASRPVFTGKLAKSC
jgi:hypothetical protein